MDRHGRQGDKMEIVIDGIKSTITLDEKIKANDLQFVIDGEHIYNCVKAYMDKSKKSYSES